jgi:putative ABC transport system substrate-binding protein
LLLRAVGLVTLLGFLVLPGTAEPQQAAKVYRIGVLAVGPFAGYAFTRQFPAALRDLGYIDGQNIVLEWRSADGRPERLTELAAELVRVTRILSSL